MLATLRVAAGGSAPPIPFAARQGQGRARSGRGSRPARRTGKHRFGPRRLDDIVAPSCALAEPYATAPRFASVDSGRDMATSSACLPRLTVTDDRIEDR